MSAGAVAAPGGGSGKKRRGADRGEPIDLDMTPMMNMLIILISFLVTMVVFTQLAVIKFSLPSSDEGGGASADTALEKDADLTLVISESGFQVIGDGRKLDPVPKGSGGYDFPGLGASLKKLREDFPAARGMVMLIDSSVIYQDIVSAMDVCREHSFPDILLSGGVHE